MTKSNLYDGTGASVVAGTTEGVSSKVDGTDLPGTSMAVLLNEIKDAVNAALAELVDDTTPQLGGDLDLNGNAITGMVIGSDVQAWAAVLDAIEEAFTTVLKAKLDGIAAGATVNSPDATLLARANHTGEEQTADIADDAVTYAKLQQVTASARLIGRNTAGAGDAEELTAATVRTMLNVEDGADVTDVANVATAGAVMDSDISAAEGFLRKTGAGAYEGIKSNLSASVAPTTGDDSGDGYAVGSVWIDTTADKAYFCLDATVAAAVWTEITQAGGGGGGFARPRTTGRYFQLADGYYGPSIATFPINAVYYCYFTVEEDQTFDRVACNVATAQASTTIRMGFYEDGGGYPTDLITDFGTVDSSTTGTKEITISEALSAGAYWRAYVSQGGTTQPTVRSLSMHGDRGHAWSSATLAWVIGGTYYSYQEGSVTGALPSTATPAIAGAGVPQMAGRLSAA